jgi:DNA-binding MarR family transcriptional regulator
MPSDPPLAAAPLVAAMQAWLAVFMRHSMQDFILFAKGRDLSLSQVGAMFHLHFQGGCGVSSLGDHLGVTSAAVSQMLDRLVQQGLTERCEASHDRRFKQITLTEKGRQVLHEAMRARTTWLEELAITLAADEQNQVLAAFDILIEKACLLEKAERLED